MSLKSFRGLWLWLASVLALLHGNIPVCGAGGFDTNGWRDLRQTIQARKLLHDDRELAHLNLGVQVVDGIATLWGPVPAAELSLRAEERLRLLVEIVEIRNWLHISDEWRPGSVSPLPIPQVLPDRPPVSAPSRETRPLVQPGVELVRELQPIEPVTVNASPAAGLERRLPLLGTITLPAKQH